MGLHSIGLDHAVVTIFSWNRDYRSCFIAVVESLVLRVEKQRGIPLRGVFYEKKGQKPVLSFIRLTGAEVSV